jgi:hypothetical protein
VGLRWWNEVNGSSGDSHWVFESAPQPNEPGGKVVTPTDKRFFWLALYAQPGLWVALAIVAIVKIHFIWLTLVGMLRPRSAKPLEESALTIISQPSRLSSLSQTLLLSPDATSSAKQAACSRQASTLLPWRETSAVLWSLAFSTGVRLLVYLRATLVSFSNSKNTCHRECNSGAIILCYLLCYWMKMSLHGVLVLLSLVGQRLRE